MEQDKLQLEVSDFGPIVRASVDLRPLTVFVGPSNTGKSYLAILIYALHRHFGDHDKGIIASAINRYRFNPPQDALPGLLADLLAAVSHPQNQTEDPSSVAFQLSPQVVEQLRAGFDSRANILGTEISRCFGVADAGSLVRKSAKHGARIVFGRTLDESLQAAHEVLVTHSSIGLKTTIPPAFNIRRIDFNSEFFLFLDASGQLRLDERRAAESDNWAVEELLSILANVLQPTIAAPLTLPAYYLPADRTGIIHAHRVVTRALIQSGALGPHETIRSPTLSGVVADFLGQLIEVDKPQGPESGRERPDLGKPIEQAVLQGSVRVRRSPTIDYPHFTYRPKGWKDDLPLNNASSMVSELAPVVLYLRHLIERNNVLIIEEPESHLHPGMQVELTRQLAKLVNAGVRVIVTTHSEWVLEELANLVKRSELPKDQRGDKCALRPNQVGTWLFEPKKRPKGSIVREISLDESGTFPSGFDDVATALHNDWADIAEGIESGA